MLELERDGVAGPYPVFTPDECARLLAELNGDPGRPKVWPKGWSATSAAYCRVATDPRILDLVRPLLGPNFVLWGTQLIVKGKSVVHSWHTDVESASLDGGFVTIWIGLENTDRGSGLKFISGSHRYGVTVQEMNSRNSVGRDSSTDDSTLAAALTLDPQAKMVQPEAGNGLGILFDGRTWHGSHNLNETTRTAILIQFARADVPVYIPRSYVWPITYRTDKRPPVVVASGTATKGVNLVVKAPKRGRPEVGNASFPLPKVPAALKGRLTEVHSRGFTPVVEDMEIRTSILPEAELAHPLYNHVEEELLVIVSGEGELRMANDAAGKNLQTIRVGPGDFGYYPAYYWHTLANVGTTPLTYGMLKWRNDDGLPEAGRLTGQFVKGSEAISATPSDGKRLRRDLLSARTRWLDRLHSHATVLPPGTGIPNHVDNYDIAILLLSGTIESLGRRVEGPAWLYHPAGRTHDIDAVGREPARYLVFEFERKGRSSVGSVFGAADRWGMLGVAALQRLRRSLKNRFA